MAAVSKRRSFGGPNERSRSSVSTPLPKEATTGRPPGPSTRSTTASAQRSGGGLGDEFVHELVEVERERRERALGERPEHRVDGPRDALRHRLEMAVELAQDRVEVSLGLPAGALQPEQDQPTCHQHRARRGDRRHHPSLSTSSRLTLFGESLLFHGPSATILRPVGAVLSARQPFLCEEIDRPPLGVTACPQSTNSSARVGRPPRRRRRPRRSEEPRRSAVSARVS